MVAMYDKHGLQFMYPENWSLATEDDGWPRSISVESPSGAFWSLHVYFPPADPRRLTEDVVKVLRTEYDPLEAQEASEQVGNVTAEGYDVTFFFLDLLITCHTRGFTLGDKTMVIMTQAEDRDFEQLEPVFRAITVSLIQNLQSQSGMP